MQSLTPRLVILLIVAMMFFLLPARALMGSHDNAPPDRGVLALEQRIVELENQVSDLQSEIDNILARLPHASGIVLDAPNRVLRLGETVQITGVVSDQFGSVLPGATVHLETTDGSIDDTAVTSNDGRFIATFTAPESFKTTATITATANGASGQMEVVTTGAPAGIGLDLANCPGNLECFWVTVIVVDSEGAPVVGAAVEWHESAGDRTFSGTTLDNGRYFVNLIEQDGLQLVNNTVTVNVTLLDVEIQRTFVF
jgi:hypothetical protein